MALQWTDWEDDPSADVSDPDSHSTPYVNWYEEVEFPEAGASRGFVLMSHSMPRVSWRMPIEFMTMNTSTNDGPVYPPPQHGVNKLLVGAWPRVPLKSDAKPGETIPDPEDRADPLARIDVPPADAVIVGVIDSCIALAHERFRTAGGQGTRILSAWNQGGRWTGRQRHLPFGSELMQADIDDLMATCRSGHGVDEDALNRAAGYSDFSDPQSDRSMESPFSHGTHVLDLAAGFSPHETDPLRQGQRDRLPIIAVNLPPRATIGPSGSFLELFAIWAIRHVVKTADSIWSAAVNAGTLEHQPGTPAGYPVVINLSYGHQAGPKDGTMRIQQYVQMMSADRAKVGFAPVSIILPAGNDNLERGTAVLDLPKGGQPADLRWRIRPEDRTSSYAEVWTDLIPADAPKGDAHPFKIALVPPAGLGGAALLAAGRPGQKCDLIHSDATGAGTLVARIYCRMHDNALPGESATSDRYVYVLCIAPTWRPGTARTPPAGAWTIRLASADPAKSDQALLYVQSDQDVNPGHGMGLLSYFDDPVYRVFDGTGRIADSYRILPNDDVDADFGTGPVRRNNTMNAIAGGPGVITVGGYRATDGMPVPYASCGRGFVRDGGQAAPSLSCVSDDAPALFGRLAAGGRSGSVVAMQGTSFATAEATRLAALAILSWIDGGRQGNAPGPSDFVAYAESVDGIANYPHPARDFVCKLGTGRLPEQAHGRVSRR